MKNEDRQLLAYIQDGIPLTEAPFQGIGASLGRSEINVMVRIRELIDAGIIRRFGARIDHRNLGIVANAMVCWKVPETQVEKIGRIIAGYPKVTHCYEREIIPGIWEYNLFCVVHGHSAEEVKQVVRNIEAQTGMAGSVILFSQKKFKHTPAVIVKETGP
jgi:siroheme decarboxylase